MTMPAAVIRHWGFCAGSPAYSQTTAPPFFSPPAVTDASCSHRDLGWSLQHIRWGENVRYKMEHSWGFDVHISRAMGLTSPLNSTHGSQNTVLQDNSAPCHWLLDCLETPHFHELPHFWKAQHLAVTSGCQPVAPAHPLVKEHLRPSTCESLWSVRVGYRSCILGD